MTPIFRQEEVTLIKDFGKIMPILYLEIHVNVKVPFYAPGIYWCARHTAIRLSVRPSVMLG